ncbi:MAG: pseudouridine-5'-phosphate glycosidase, partial [Proteobacteria bacterium]|nr:pseudouridine-5'-phosphate glycosidase [Pseudomonadota bacterium]
ISADLAELAQTNIAVVCSGAKSILDLPKTLEVLETNGVPVIGFGTDRFPAFHCRDSGLHLEARADTPQDAARIVAAQRRLGLAGGLVIANPVPAADEIAMDELDAWTASANDQARAQGITGKDLTPYLLDRLAALSGGRTIKTNMALVINNAAVAARIAIALAGERAGEGDGKGKAQ